MRAKRTDKRKVEAYMLSAARNAGIPVPDGEIPGEKPDFRFETEAGPLGVEMSEVLRPASSNHGIVPVEQETFHEGIMEAAQAEYYRNAQARPVRVQVYFADAKGKKQDKRAMARALAQLVAANAHRANPFLALDPNELPAGFSSVTINSLWTDDWWSGEVGGYNILTDTRSQLAERISSKNNLIPTYRANVGGDARLWLLLYSGVTVARSMSIPCGIQEWEFPFAFDRVFWFASLENEFVEIQRTESAKGVAV